MKTNETENPVKTIKLGQPVKFSTFKSMSTETRREYIDHLYKKYPKLPTDSIAEMFGTSVRMLKMEMAVIGVTPAAAGGKTANESKIKFKKEVLDPMKNGNIVVIAEEKTPEKKKETAKDVPKPIMSVSDITKPADKTDNSLLIRAAGLKKISWKELQSLNKSMKKAYIEAIFKKFPGITARYLQELFGAPNVTAIYSLCKALKIGDRRVSHDKESIKRFCIEYFGKDDIFDSSNAGIKDIAPDDTPKKVVIGTDKIAERPITTAPVEIEPAPELNPAPEVSEDIKLEPEVKQAMLDCIDKPDDESDEIPDNTEEKKIVDFNDDLDFCHADQHEAEENQTPVPTPMVINKLDMVIDADGISNLIKALGISGKVHIVIDNNI